MGNYLECVFPFLGVRYLSVNDSYDSDDYKGMTSGMDVVLRNIIYRAYSKDLSVKTTTAKIIMMKQGQIHRRLRSLWLSVPSHGPEQAGDRRGLGGGGAAYLRYDLAGDGQAPPSPAG